MILKMLLIPQLLGLATLVGMGTAEEPAGAGTTIGAIALLVTALATAYGVLRRTQKQTKAKVEHNERRIETNAKTSQKYQERFEVLDKNAVRRAEMDGWRQLIVLARGEAKEARDEAKEAREEVHKERRRLVAERAAGNERYIQMERQYTACEEGRISLTAQLAALRAKVEMLHPRSSDAPH